LADVVEEIKSRLGIQDLVSQYVQLKKAGVNYKGLCPFHGEKTPSFVVSPEKQICHCFGCGRGGDIFTFIQELEGITFSEALQVLGDKAGVKIDESKIKKSVVSKSVKDEFFKAHVLACEFFEDKLWNSDDGKKVLKYLYKRGLNDDFIREFRLGFAPDSYDDLYPALLEKGVSREVLLKSGFVSTKGVDGIYDKYRARLMFPIFDYLGRVAGFGGRALKADQMPKYLNSPENVIYNKSKILYALSHAKSAIKSSKYVVLVEGYFDVVLPFQYGVKNIVATSGTALTKGHIRLLKRLTSNVVACFDSDSAGLEATKRAYSLLSAEGVLLKVVNGLSKKDPAEYVLEDGADFQGLLDSAVDFISFYMDILLEKNDKNSLDGRRVILSELLPLLKSVAAVEKDFFVRELASKLGVHERHIYDQIANTHLSIHHPSNEEDFDSKKSFKLGTKSCLLGIFLENPKLFKSELSDLFFEAANLEEKAIYKALEDQYNSFRDGLKQWNFDSSDFDCLKGKINVLRLYVEHKYEDFSLEALGIEVEKLVDKVVKTCREKDLNVLFQKISQAEELGDMEKLKELLSEQQKLLSRNYEK